jgi:hypothetical protein
MSIRCVSRSFRARSLARPLSLLAALSITAAAGAELPIGFTYQIQVRNNFASNPGGSFNIPGSWFFDSNSTPALSNNNKVAQKIGVTDGDYHALWVGGDGVGGVVHSGPTGSFFSAPSINNAGDVVFEQQFTAANGIYRYRQSTGLTSILTTRPLGATGWSSVQINELGQVGYRANFSGAQAYVSFAGELNPPFHATDASLDPMSPYSFIFTPSFNNNRQIAAFVRRGLAGQNGSSQPDEIRIFSADGSSTLIAQDRNANPASNFASFDNSVSLNNQGWVAFQANLFSPSGVRGVFASNGATTVTIALTNGGTISNLEFFAPSLNNNGLIAFRAFDTAGKRAVWMGDINTPGTVVRVASEEQIIPTDLGDGRIDQNDSSPVFGGGVRINDSGNVAFNAALTPPGNNQIEWGTGIFVARAQFAPPPVCNGDADGSNTVDFSDVTSVLANFGAIVAPYGPGDADGSGVVDFSDVTSVLANFGAVCS